MISKWIKDYLSDRLVQVVWLIFFIVEMKLSYICWSVGCQKGWVANTGVLVLAYFASTFGYFILKIIYDKTLTKAKDKDCNV